MTSSSPVSRGFSGDRCVVGTAGAGTLPLTGVDSVLPRPVGLATVGARESRRRHTIPGQTRGCSCERGLSPWWLLPTRAPGRPEEDVLAAVRSHELDADGEPGGARRERLADGGLAADVEGGGEGAVGHERPDPAL